MQPFQGLIKFAPVDGFKGTISGTTVQGLFIETERSSYEPPVHDNEIGIHRISIDLTLWFMGNPKPIAVTGVSRTELAHKKGAFSIWGGLIPQEMNVEEFASAFVRFDNGATLILEVSWLLHHDTEGEDMQMWLYGTEGGSHWPKGEILQTNYDTQQHYNRR